MPEKILESRLRSLLSEATAFCPGDIGCFTLTCHGDNNDIVLTVHGGPSRGLWVLTPDKTRLVRTMKYGERSA